MFMEDEVHALDNPRLYRIDSSPQIPPPPEIPQDLLNNYNDWGTYIQRTDRFENALDAVERGENF